MMHGHEKSDPEIVAIRTNAGGIHRDKPANTAAPAAAELVERWAGTKGNADQQSTLRAQDRAGVSQALERIRQAARHNNDLADGGLTVAVAATLMCTGRRRQVLRLRRAIARRLAQAPGTGPLARSLQGPQEYRRLWP
jgi:hypothetical protein